MIDTLKLNLKDVSIKSSSSITVQPGNYTLNSKENQFESDLFVNDKGVIITGNKAFLNTDKWNLTINPSIEVVKLKEKTVLLRKKFDRIYEDENFADINSDSEDDVNGIFVETSIPRLKSENNFKSLSIEEEVEHLNFLEKDLKKYGISTNIFDSDISRIDSFTNINSDYSFSSYSPLFNLMECSRKKSVEWNGETFLWKNSECQLTCYDKIEQMSNKYKNFTPSKNNVIRIESRLLKKRKVKAVFEFTKLSELFKNYDVLKNSYKKEVSTNIFKYDLYDLPEIDLMTDESIQADMLICKKVYSRQWFQKYLMIKGIQSIMKSSSIDNLMKSFKVIEEKSRLRMRKSRINKMITEMKMILPESSLTNYKTNRELYNELKQKFFRQVA